MTVLTKERLLNWKKLCLFLLMFIALLMSYFFISGIFEFVFRFDVNAPDLGDRGEEARLDLLSHCFGIHEYMYTVDCMSKIAPLIIFAFSFFFFEEKRAVFYQKYVRGQSQKRVIISSLLYHSLYVAVGFYLVYMIYLTIGWFTMRIEPSQYPLTTLDALFGDNFYNNYPFLYFTVCGFYQAFMGALVYSLFSCSICLVVDKAYKAILFSSIYYFGFTLLCMALPLNRTLFHCIQPAMLQGFTCYVYEDPLLLDAIAPLLTLVIPLAISAGIVIYTLKRGEKI